MQDDPMPDDGRTLREAAFTGARRAAGHFLRAGIEVVYGIGSFLDEIRRTPDTEPQLRSVPFDDDDDEPVGAAADSEVEWVVVEDEAPPEPSDD